MLESFLSAEGLIALLSLTALEIVLGLDNIVSLEFGVGVELKRGGRLMAGLGVNFGSRTPNLGWVWGGELIGIAGNCGFLVD